MPSRTVRLATRGSDLALRQAAQVKDDLERRHFEVELVEVGTPGDEIRDELIHRLGTTGAFVRSLDEKVLESEVDAAVHSMKDVPTESPDDLVVAAIPQRGPPGDVLVTPDGTDLDGLPEGAVVGTASLRRGAQVLARRPELTIEPLRGNVDTRVEKLLAPHLQREHQRRTDAEESDEVRGGQDGGGEFDRTAEEWFDDLTELERQAMERKVDTEFDAILLAQVGLERLGIADQVETTPLSPAEFVPAPGQGALAVTASDDDLAGAIHDAADHPRTRVETTVERTILGELGGGCVAPIGVYAVLQGEYVRVNAAVFDREGDREISTSRDLPVEDYHRKAQAFADDLADRGADELIAEARRDDDEEGVSR